MMCLAKKKKRKDAIEFKKESLRKMKRTKKKIKSSREKRKRKIRRSGDQNNTYKG